MANTIVRILIAPLCAVPLAGGASAQSLAPDIVITKVVSAPVAGVWKAWTTVEGVSLMASLEKRFMPK